MGKLKGGKRIKLKNFQKFNFGYIIIASFLAILIFLIGRAIGKKEEFYSNRRYTEDMNDKLLNRRLMLLNQI